jgi:hypothetical protein
MRSVSQKLRKLVQMRAAIERAQAKVDQLTGARDELITDMLLSQVATGVVIGGAAGVSQPRTVQIKSAVVARRLEEAEAARLAEEAAAAEERHQQQLARRRERRAERKREREEMAIAS